MATRRKIPRRTGGVYIAVLGSAMIIALLGLCALIGQRIQNRLVVATTDIRQAQLNASTAVELAILAMKQDTNWRTTYANGNWFTNRSTGAGTCTANVIDPIDSSLSNNPDDPVVVTGIGYSGQAEQRVKVTVDSRKDPLSCLRSAVAAGNNITLNADILRINGLATANQVSASSSQFYGKVEATSVSGSTYNGTTTQVTSEKRPTMPDWTSVFNYYRTNATQLDISQLPTTTGSPPGYLGRNVSIENGTTDWTGSLTGMPTSDISQSNNQIHSGSYSLRLQNRTAWNAGAGQYIDGYIKPGQQYTIDGWVYMPGILSLVKNFRFTLFLKGTGGSVQSDIGTDTPVFATVWTKISATLTAPVWSGNLEYAFIKIAGADSLNTNDFYFDDFSIRETTTGRFIYRGVLSPSVNTLYSGAPTNAAEGKSHGIYKIDCGGQKLVIERSRILGTLLVTNPGAGSCINNGPISWSPAVAGYPALLVDATTATDANFSLRPTNRLLNEAENQVNFNPAGAPFDFANSLCSSTDAAQNDVYPSEIRGLVVIRNDLTYQNRTLVRGQVIVGDDISNSSGELEVDFQPDALLNPPPGFFSPYSYLRRRDSIQKVVLP